MINSLIKTIFLLCPPWQSYGRNYFYRGNMLSLLLFKIHDRFFCEENLWVPRSYLFVIYIQFCSLILGMFSSLLFVVKLLKSLDPWCSNLHEWLIIIFLAQLMVRHKWDQNFRLRDKCIEYPNKNTFSKINLKVN